MRVNLLKPFFRVKKEHPSPHIPLYRKPYLSTAVFSFFVLPMSCYYSSTICLCSEQQITVWLFLSSGQPTVCFLFRLSASLPHCPHLLIVFASVCPLLFMESKNCRSTEKWPGAIRCLQPRCPVSAKRLWRGLVRDRKPSVTSATSPP